MPREKHIGICHICGKMKSLSFEHVPPRSMGNDSTTKAYKAADIIEHNRGFDLSEVDGLRYVQQQRGSGYQTICRSCNSYLGKHYVKEYAGCITELGQILASNPPEKGSDGIHLEGCSVNLLAFFKHVISNFCSSTREGSMLDCKDFLLDYRSNSFPSGYRLYMFAIPNQREGFVSTGWSTIIPKNSQGERNGFARLLPCRVLSNEKTAIERRLYFYSWLRNNRHVSTHLERKTSLLT